MQGGCKKNAYGYSMIEKINAYYIQVQHLADPLVQAQIMLDLFTDEHGKKCKKIDFDHRSEDLDEALNRFYSTKECQYVRALLEYYVENGTFDLPVERQDIIQRLDRFKNIRALLIKLLPVKEEVKIQENNKE